MAKEYVPWWQKLQDPRWQRKRLEILERDDYACVVCFNDQETLHVHHGYYEHGWDPWEYDNDTLHTLCKTCHDQVTEYSQALSIEVGRCNPEVVSDLIAIVLGIRMMRAQISSGEAACDILDALYSASRDVFWSRVKQGLLSKGGKRHEIEADIAIGMGASA